MDCKKISLKIRLIFPVIRRPLPKDNNMRREKAMNGTIRTDLALESREMHPEVAGVSEEKARHGRISISRITLSSPEAAHALGKEPGEYVTLNAPEPVSGVSGTASMLSRAIAEELTALLSKVPADAPILVAGLGNRAVTPDSLGPRVADGIFVTRHVKRYLADALPKSVREVSAVAPGVLGVTGMETLEIVRGVAERTGPSLIIAVDSLASRRAERIGAAVQLTNTGINPGAGIGNDRQGLTEATLGVPVLAVGAPLVVYAGTIARDTLDLIAEKTGRSGEDEMLRSTAENVIKEHMGDLIVTPKEIDSLVCSLARVIAEGINLALFGADHAKVRSLIA